MKHVSDEAIDEVLIPAIYDLVACGCCHGNGRDFSPQVKIDIRTAVRNWVQQHVSFRDIYAPQLQTKVPIQEVE